jgi:hypothetical protein
MENHFCMCHVDTCPNNPRNHDKGCDPCMQKILDLGEVPACVWNNLQKGFNSKSEWSIPRFVQYCMDNKPQENTA